MRINRYTLKSGYAPPKDDLILGRRFVLLSEEYEISLSIETNLRKPVKVTDDFDVDYFVVLDEAFLQPYIPFYRTIGEDVDEDSYLARVVSKYNEVMDSLDWLERREE